MAAFSVKSETRKRKLKRRRQKPREARITLYGAAGEVTGSRYLIETDQARVLLECGMFQGERHAEQRNRAGFGFEPAQLSAVVLSHAHLDHTGLLPRLVKEGYDGPVYTTMPTRDLLSIMLEDAAHIQMKDVEWENKRRQRAGKMLLSPLYDVEDARRAMRQCKSVSYGERKEIADGISVIFRDAGHILGSAIVDLSIRQRNKYSRLVFSGDLGNQDSVILPEPDKLSKADILFLESTYGDRNHKSFSQTRDELARALSMAADSGGNVLIPAFAVGRTQEVLYTLGELWREGRLPQGKVFLDSPMAIATTQVYDKYMSLFAKEDRARLTAADVDNLKSWLPCLQFSESPEESMAINRITGGAIIIAGSGMCNGGRIRHHLKYNLWRREAHVVFCGFQAAGTPGRALVDGAKRIRLLGSEIAVGATLHTLGGFSAHAGQDQLVDWASGFSPRPRLYLVHGEPEKRNALAERIAKRLGWQAQQPSRGARIFLTG